MLNIQPIDGAYSQECLAILNESFDVPWAEIQTVFMSENNLVLGAFSNNKLVGFAVAAMVLDEGEVLMCAVRPSAQRKGIGCQLVRGLLNECRQRNILNFFLEVDETNVAAQGLYQKFGFQVVGKRKAYYQRLDGTFNDALIMRCGDG